MENMRRLVDGLQDMVARNGTSLSLDTLLNFACGDAAEFALNGSSRQAMSNSTRQAMQSDIEHLARLAAGVNWSLAFDSREPVSENLTLPHLVMFLNRTYGDMGNSILNRTASPTKGSDATRALQC